MTDEVLKQLADASYSDVPEGQLPRGIEDVDTQGRDISKLQGWEIIDYDGEQNTTSGLYAIAFRSPTGEIVVSYRGSEAFEKGHINDWQDNTRLAVTSDTEQQKAAANFLRFVMDKYPDQSVSITGHSKGGNDALYAAVTADEPYRDRIASVVTFNAPGFGSEFLARYDSQINAVKGRLTEYQNEADIVSSLLYNIGIVKICTSTDPDNPMNFGTNHGFEGFTFNEDGSIVLKKYQVKAVLCNIIHCIAGYVEVIPGFLLDTVLAMGFKLAGSWQTGNFDAIDGVIIAVIATAVMALLANPVAFAAVALAVIETLRVIGAIAVLITYAAVKIGAFVAAGVKMACAAALAVMAFLENLANLLVDLFTKAIEAAVGMFTAMKEAILDLGAKLLAGIGDFCNRVGQAVSGFFEGVRNWISSLFGTASSIISSVPCIAVIISEINALQRKLVALRQSYLDTKAAMNNTNALVSKVSAYYNESYVRGCCRDIELGLRNARRYLDAVERELDKKCRALAEAVDAYYHADQDAARNTRSTAQSLA